MMESLDMAEQVFAESLQRFVASQIVPVIERGGDESRCLQAVVDRLFERRYLAIEVEENLGGAGGTCGMSIQLIEALAKIDTRLSAIVDEHTTTVTEIFLRWASDDQRERYLSRLLTQDQGVLRLEGTHRGPLTLGLSAKAFEEDKFWRLSSEKLRVFDHHEGSVYIIFAQTSSEIWSQRFTAFICEADTPGFTLTRSRSHTDSQSPSFVDLIMNDVRVPKENVIGKVGDGYSMLTGMLSRSRINVAAQILGVAQTAYTEASTYARQREEDHVGGGDNAYLELAEIQQSIDEARSLLFTAARLCSAGKNFAEEAALAQMRAVSVAERLVKSGLQMPKRTKPEGLLCLLSRTTFVDSLSSLLLSKLSTPSTGLLTCSMPVLLLAVARLLLSVEGESLFF